MLPKDACTRDGASCPQVTGTVNGNAPWGGSLSFQGSSFGLLNALQLLLSRALLEVALLLLCSTPEAAPVLNLRQKGAPSAPSTLFFLPPQPSRTPVLRIDQQGVMEKKEVRPHLDSLHSAGEAQAWASGLDWRSAPRETLSRSTGTRATSQSFQPASLEWALLGLETRSRFLTQTRDSSPLYPTDSLQMGGG